MSDVHPQSDTAPAPTGSGSDAALEELRAILLDPDRRRAHELESEFAELDLRLTDERRLAGIIAPILTDALRRRIRDARDEMIEALYPIIGQTVVRAVSEAIRDLARNVDAQMRFSFSPRTTWRRMQARVRGVSFADATLRDALPFSVTEVFLVHAETGLLLLHISPDPKTSDSDLVSSMLTAIRDFAQEAFGRGEMADLDGIQYGERRIIIEAAQTVYLAVVVDGVEPAGFRTTLRERVIEISQTYADVLTEYNGDPDVVADAAPLLDPLVATSEEQAPTMDSAQKWILVGLVAVVLLCAGTAVTAGRWAWLTWQPIPTPTAPPPTSLPLPTATLLPSPTVMPSSTPTPTPTVTPSPTPTMTPTSTHTPAPTLTPAPASMIGVMIGSEWAHDSPALGAPRTGRILSLGQPVEILAVYGEWAKIRWVVLSEGENVGWIQTRWVGTLDVVPERLVTPTAAP